MFNEQIASYFEAVVTGIGTVFTFMGLVMLVMLSLMFLPFYVLGKIARTVTTRVDDHTYYSKET